MNVLSLFMKRTSESKFVILCDWIFDLFKLFSFDITSQDLNFFSFNLI